MTYINYTMQQIALVQISFNLVHGPFTCLLSGSIGVGGAFFGQGTGVIFADTGSCLGNTSSTANCIANSYCSHQSDAGVFCVGECKE